MGQSHSQSDWHSRAYRDVDPQCSFLDRFLLMQHQHFQKSNLSVNEWVAYFIDWIAYSAIMLVRAITPLSFIYTAGMFILLVYV